MQLDIRGTIPLAFYLIKIMTIKINNLENLDLKSENLQDISDAEAARISGGDSSLSFTSVLNSDGSSFTEKVTMCGTVTTTVTTELDADGTGFVTTKIIDSSLNTPTSGTAPAFRTPIGNPQ